MLNKDGVGVNRLGSLFTTQSTGQVLGSAAITLRNYTGSSAYANELHNRMVKLLFLIAYFALNLIENHRAKCRSI